MPCLAKTEALSQRRERGDLGFGHQWISCSKFLNHSASLQADAKATNSVTIVESTIHICFFDTQDIAPLLRVKIHPLVEEWFSLSAIQLASKNLLK